MEAPAEGLIFNIQRFSIQDGPGIRTTVFFKGCHLACPWCSNPESIHPYPEVIVREVKCIRCGACVNACEGGAIQMAEDRRVIDFERCDHCMRCVQVCTARAIQSTGQRKEVTEIIDVVRRDAGYYCSTGGGLTLSGGEPLNQWRFARELAKAARSEGFHVALDTSGHASQEAFSAVMEYIDLVLFDVKHMDAKIHQEFTGVSNQRILDNLRLILLETEAAVWVRIPIIPGFNQSKEAIAAIGKYLHTLPRPVEKVSLLPFHQFGSGKYTDLGRQYRWARQYPLADEQVEGFKRLLEGLKLKVDIGR